MKNDNPYQDMSFSRQSRLVPVRLIAMMISLCAFTVLWMLVPSGILYWLLLPFQAVLIWLASHGWRRALFALKRIIHQLEQIDNGGI